MADDQSDFGKVLVDEIKSAFAEPTSGILDTLRGGIFLGPFTDWAETFEQIVIQWANGVTQNLRRLPSRIITKYALLNVNTEDSTRVVTLKEAKRFALLQCAAAVYAMAGTSPGYADANAVLKKAEQLKGIRKRMISKEELIILGPILKKLLTFVRSPIALVVRLVFMAWEIMSAILAIGAAIALWKVFSSDWSEVALSQKHPRKWTRERVYKRL